MLVGLETGGIDQLLGAAAAATWQRVVAVTVVPAQVTLQRGGCRIELRLYAQVHLDQALAGCAPVVGLPIERER